MVIARASQVGAASFAFALVLAGCLSKPNPPAATSDGGTDGMTSDVPIDAPPACQGATAAHWDPDFAMERVARIMDFNHDGADDVIVFGRVGAAAPFMAHAYVVLGREPMTLECSDYDITPSMMGDLIDVWVGEITGDNVDDLALLVNTGTHYYLELYPGRPGAGGGLMPRITQMVPYSPIGLDANIGGTPGNRSPAFLTAFRYTGNAALVFGGLHQPWAAAPFDSGALGAVIPVGDAGGGPFAMLDPSEGVWAHTAGTADNELIAATTSGMLRRLQHLGTDASAAHFDLLDTPIQVNVGIDGGGRDRTVRVWNRPYETDGTLAAAEGANGIAILGYHTYTNPNGGFSSVHIDTPDDFAGGYDTIKDYAFGNLDGNRSEPIDVIALGAAGQSARRLNVHPNLVFAPDGSGLIPVDTALHANLTRGETLAVGDFDSETSTEDQILVLHSPIGGSIGACYEVHRPSSTACIVRCGQTTCL